MPVRTFIAIELSEQLRSRIMQMVADLAPCSVKVKWVERKNMHLTLKFLGDVSEELLPTIGTSLKEAINGIGGFRAECRGVGAFPHVGRPQTIWIAVERGQPELQALHGKVERCLAPLGIPPEPRPYHPHITVGRVRSGRDMKQLSNMLRDRASEDFGAVNVTAVTLFSSQLGSTGPVYTALEHVSLGGS